MPSYSDDFTRGQLQRAAQDKRSGILYQEHEYGYPDGFYYHAEYSEAMHKLSLLGGNPFVLNDTASIDPADITPFGCLACKSRYHIYDLPTGNLNAGIFMLWPYVPRRRKQLQSAMRRAQPFSYGFFGCDGPSYYLKQLFNESGYLLDVYFQPLIACQNTGDDNSKIAALNEYMNCLRYTRMSYATAKPKIVLMPYTHSDMRDRKYLAVLDMARGAFKDRLRLFYHVSNRHAFSRNLREIKAVLSDYSTHLYREPVRAGKWTLL